MAETKDVSVNSSGYTQVTDSSDGLAILDNPELNGERVYYHVGDEEPDVNTVAKVELKPGESFKKEVVGHIWVKSAARDTTVVVCC